MRLVPALFFAFIIAAVSPATAQTFDSTLILYPSTLIESQTRYPLPPHRITESVTVITQEDIERSYARNLSEVLRQFAGIFLSENGDIGSQSLLYTTGTDPRHLKLIVDGIEINQQASGQGIANGILISAVKRIEIIRGPSSATWGSALGGLVNVIMKDAGITAKPHGAIRAEVGENDTTHFNGEISGRKGDLRYRLNMEQTDSDGLMDRPYHRTALDGRFTYLVTPGLEITTFFGYTDPWNSQGYSRSHGVEVTSSQERWRIGMETEWADSPYQVNLRLYQMNQNLGQKTASFPDPLPDYKQNYDERTLGATATLLYRSSNFDFLTGTELKKKTLFHNTIDERALFGNLPLKLGRLTVVPGLRFDSHETAGDYLSPSIGIAWNFHPKAIWRFNITQGFNAPPPMMVIGEEGRFNPNLDLGHETVKSVSTEIELFPLDNLNLRWNIFYSDIEDAIDHSTETGQFINNGDLVRKGTELFINWHPQKNLTLRGGFTHSYSSPYLENYFKRQTNATLSMDYRPSPWSFLVTGRYNKTEYIRSSSEPSEGLVWDTVISREFRWRETLVNLYLKGENLFSARYSLHTHLPNPDRRIFGGINITF